VLMLSNHEPPTAVANTLVSGGWQAACGPIGSSATEFPGYSATWLACTCSHRPQPTCFFVSMRRVDPTLDRTRPVLPLNLVERWFLEI